MKRIIEYKDLLTVIDKLLRDRESSEIEYKSATGGFPGSFWETYSSFANTHGGTIILGVKERGDHFFLDGLTEEQTKKYQRDFFNNMHSKKNVNVALLKEDDVQTVKLGRDYFMFFYIPQVDRSRRPVF